MNTSDQEELRHSSSRVQAIADGVLVDVSATARQAGIPYPTAVTQAAFETYIRVPAGVVGQDEAGRLWDILSLLVVAIRQATARPRTDVPGFTVAVAQSESAGPRPTLLKALCHPGDDGEPVSPSCCPTKIDERLTEASRAVPSLVPHWLCSPPRPICGPPNRCALVTIIPEVTSVTVLTATANHRPS